MKRRIVCGMILMIGAVLFLQYPVHADTYELTEMWSTAEKMEISKDGGITWFTVFEGNTDPMSLIGQPAVPTGDGTVPAGHYNTYRVHITYSRFVIEYSDGTNGTSYVYDNSGNPYIEDSSVDITNTDSMSATVSRDGTTNAYIDFDPAASVQSCTAVWDGSKYVLTDFQFEPVVSVHE